MKYIAIVGTNASFSYNRKLLWYMKNHFSSIAELEIVEIADVPLFSEDFDELPAALKSIAAQIVKSDGVIFSTPEYDHAITAALKSLLEWLSWQNLKVLTEKPAMIVGTSLGNLGTVFAQENLRQILNSPGIDAFVLPSNQFLLGQAEQAFDEKGNLIHPKTIDWLEHCFANFNKYVHSVKNLNFDDVDATTGASEE